MAGENSKTEDWFLKYKAIDGQEKDENILSIRSDIVKICQMGDSEFEQWYTQRKQATERLIADYEIFSTIPDIRYGREDQQLTMERARTHVGTHLRTLKAGLEYLDALKDFRATKFKTGEITFIS